MVMSEDSCSKGRGFKSRRCILDGHFLTLICCKNCLKRLKISEKEAGVGPFFKKKDLSRRWLEIDIPIARSKFSTQLQGSPTVCTQRIIQAELTFTLKT